MTFHFVFIMSLATSNFVFSQILVFFKFTIRKENSEFDFPFYLIGIFVKEFTFFFPRTKLVDSRNKEQNRVNFEPFSFCHSAIWKWSILKHVYIMLCLTHNLNLTADPTDESRTQTCLSLRFLLFIHSRCIK